MDYIQTSAVDKMAKFLDKGLDPNYQDADTGGKECYWALAPYGHLAFIPTPLTFYHLVTRIIIDGTCVVVIWKCNLQSAVHVKIITLMRNNLQKEE